MSESHFLRRRWKLLLNLFTVGALVVLAIVLRHQIAATLNNFGKVNTWALLLIIPLEALNYHAQTKLYIAMFSLLGDRISYKFMYRTSLELNLVNNVFPSGGVSGFSYFGVRMRTQGIRAGRATLVQMMKLVMVFISFEALLMVGLLLLALGGRANNLTILVGGSLATLLIVLTGGMAFIIGSKKRINAFFTYITRALNRIIHIVRPNHPETINVAKARRLFTDLHENYAVLRGKLPQLKKPLLYALLANATEVGAVYVIYIAFGHWVNPGAVILAYAMANFAGLISVLPGGVGIYEAIMTAVLAAAGVSPGISIPVTIMYRVVNMTIQLTPGYYFYHKALQDKELPDD